MKVFHEGIPFCRYYKCILLSVLSVILLFIILKLMLNNYTGSTNDQSNDTDQIFKTEDFLSTFTRYSSIPPVKQKWNILLADDRFCDDSANIWKNKLQLLFVVRSKDFHFTKREEIRNTWGNHLYTEGYGMRSRTLFVLQVSALTPLKTIVEKEQAVHGDILLFTTPDQHSNTAEKLLETLKFITSYCSEISYIALLNDDILVDPYHLISDLKKVPSSAFPAYSGGVFFHLIGSHPLFLRSLPSRGSAVHQPVYHLDGTLVVSMPVARLLTVGLLLLKHTNRSESYATADILTRYGLLPKQSFGLLEKQYVTRKAVFMKVGKDLAAETISKGWQNLHQLYEAKTGGKEM